MRITRRYKIEIKITIKIILTETTNVACMGKIRNSHTVLVGKREKKGPLRRTTHRWEDNIKLELNEMRCEGIDSFVSG
jgi:hypothetical protein